MLKQWTIGLINAAISGATVVGVGYSVDVGWKKLGFMAAASAFVSLNKYLAQHPLPGGMNGNGGAH